MPSLAANASSVPERFGARWLVALEGHGREVGREGLADDDGATGRGAAVSPCRWLVMPSTAMALPVSWLLPPR